MARIEIQNVSKSFGGHDALKNLSLDIADGEFLVLVGPSGCGKSTLLRMIAGLEPITGGEILLDGGVVNDLEARDRDLAMIFQTYALFPHMTVRENLAFGMKLRKVEKAEADRRIERAASTLGLQPYMDRRPLQLSGGQRQRVAIGRALVRQPKAFLMDEPLANLDTKLRVHMRTEFLRLREMLKTTTVYVTHDQTEALTLGHRVCVMSNGKIQQVAPPDDLFNHPANIFVAGFIGTPEMNLVVGEIEQETVRIGQFTLPLTGIENRQQLKSGTVIVGIRPTDFEVVANGQAASIKMVPELVERLGSETMVIFKASSTRVAADHFSGPNPAAIDSSTAKSSVCDMTAAVPGRFKVVVGQETELFISPDRLHFFDPRSGQNLLPSAQ